MEEWRLQEGHKLALDEAAHGSLERSFAGDGIGAGLGHVAIVRYGAVNSDLGSGEKTGLWTAPLRSLSCGWLLKLLLGCPG